ncbi:MAG TPA: phosphoribosylamine--glycine ligase [Candidatus Limnocylindria bacterium]|nr:phosphoribosylamine--glycine ligase [Candidatus Limnocylindria bacterium]
MSERHRILVVGDGGREHALAWRLARDPEVERVSIAPGNDGMAREFRCLPIPASDSAQMIRACRNERIDLAVIGPEAPLAAGLADSLRASGIPTFGPRAAAAQIEASKWFAKEIMAEAEVPTARAERFEALEPALAAMSRFGPPWVVKADGLMGGKGVCVTSDRAVAEAALVQALAPRGGDSRRVVIESFLAGEEVSVMAVCDGRGFVVLPAARDYKLALDGDRGANTGGMGAYAPSAKLDAGLEADVGARVFAPVLARMAARGTPFQGVLYAGLMLTADGLQVVEFNCRFGDPEAEVVLPLINGSLARLFASAAAGELDSGAITRAPNAAVGVVIAAEGYPEAPRPGGVIEGLDALMARRDLHVFHAGTKREGGAWRVSGGRAAHVVAVADTVASARARVYEALAELKGEGWRYRRDIANPAPPVPAVERDGATSELRGAGAR